METVEDIVIIGAGIAGLTTSLGLHRYVLLTYILREILQHNSMHL